MLLFAKCRYLHHRPNELFKTQRTMSADISSKEKSCRAPERTLKPYKTTQSTSQYQKSTTVTSNLKRAESMKLKGEWTIFFLS